MKIGLVAGTIFGYCGYYKPGKDEIQAARRAELKENRKKRPGIKNDFFLITDFKKRNRRVYYLINLIHHGRREWQEPFRKKKMKTTFEKYAKPERIPLEHRDWIDREITQAPIWCSVDLRDGNQALPMPMNPEKKLEYFKLLCDVGFKEIEVSFPSASQDDFNFVRRLIEGKLIPKDVRISVLTQARESLIKRTVESIRGQENALLHLYVATSDLHSKIVFGKTHEEVLEMAVEGTKSVIKYLKEAGLWGKVAYEFSPEEFTDSDLDFVVEVCKAVKETWGPSAKNSFILNLPQTVERRPPFHYADMIEYFIKHYPYMSETTISVHSHNDQGCAAASTEMTLMAGAERVEGTLLGHGERTGNLDILILGLNLKSRGVDPKLDFSDINHIIRVIEKATGIEVHERHPYAGQLVFTAFSGSHQDAIRKGLENREKASEMFHVGWKVPYLHIDPADVGRKYEKLIRINSQSGKGGVAYVLEHEYGIFPPKSMHPFIGAAVQAYADRHEGELDDERLIDIFNREFVNFSGPFELKKFSRIISGDHNDNAAESLIEVKLSIQFDGQPMEIQGRGNGPLSATVHAIRDAAKLYSFVLEDFAERTLGTNADADALAFVGIRRKSDNALYYGAGRHANIDQAAILALFAALNKAILSERSGKQ